MGIPATSYYIFVILAALLCAGLVPSLVYAFRQTRLLTRPGSWAVLIPHLSFSILYLVLNTLEILSPTPALAQFFASLCYVSNTTVPTWWFLFCLHYSGLTVLVRRISVVLWIVPVAAIAIAVTNPIHHWHWERVSFSRVGPFMRMAVELYGPWFWFLSFYTVLISVLGTLVLLISMVRRSLSLNRQVVLIAGAALVPILLNAIYLLRLVPGWYKDFTPIGYAIAGLLATIGVFHDRLFDVLPIARRAILEALPDAVVAIEGGVRLLEMNRRAKLLFGLEGVLVGGSIPAESPLNGALAAFSCKDAIELEREGAGCYEGRCTHVLAGGRQISIYSFRDITERRRLLEDKTRLVTELSAALSEIKTLQGMVPICSSCKKIRDDTGFWQQVDEYLSSHSELEFTHGVCPECRARLYGSPSKADN